VAKASLVAGIALAPAADTDLEAEDTALAPADIVLAPADTALAVDIAAARRAAAEPDSNSDLVQVLEQWLALPSKLLR
jgi:hypothetical protein